MEKVSVLAITKNGINIGEKLKELFPNWDIFVPSKLSNENKSITWYSEPTSDKIIELFKNSNALICLFSLGAVIRLIAPYLKDKKTDPAVIVIDDKTNFVISVLSGHIGGANELTQEISEKLNALPVITTAADVNKTIAVDLVGREFGWKIDDETTVTKISAHMVNAEPIGVFQQTGNKKWYKKLPKNVTIYNSLEELKKSNSKAHLIISDTIIDNEISSRICNISSSKFSYWDRITLGYNKRYNQRWNRTLFKKIQSKFKMYCKVSFNKKNLKMFKD